MRQKKVKPLLDKVYEIINTLRHGKGYSLGKAVTYAQNQKEKLYLFLDDPDVEMTNNLVLETTYFVIFAALYFVTQSERILSPNLF